jgi:hypothetical protein
MRVNQCDAVPIAVNGMHFTGMSAMSVQPRPTTGLPARSASATTLLIPIGLAVVFGVLGLVYALMAALAATEPPPAVVPQQRQPSPRRMPSSGSSWTFRDRAEK